MLGRFGTFLTQKLLRFKMISAFKVHFEKYRIQTLTFFRVVSEMYKRPDK